MLSLLNAGLLPWLAAAAVPLLIHLLTRQARRRMDLPTVRFLQRTLANQSRLFRWRHLILLLLRTLAILALVFAFTRPTLRSPLAASGGERVGMVVLLDVSASMSYSAGGLTSLAKARSEAIRALQGLKPGDRANLVVCAAQPLAALTEPTPDLAAVQNAVRTAPASEERADPVAAVNLAVEQLAKTNTSARRLVICSDFQRTNWADVRFESVPVNTKILFVNTEASRRENLGLTAIRVRPSTPRVGETVTLACELFNAGDAPKTVPVTLSLTNGRRYTETVSLGPYSSATASFPLAFGAPQQIECTAAIPTDNLAVDNTRRAVIDWQRMAAVVMVTDENPSAPPGASFFLARALHPDPHSNAGFRVLPVRPGALNNPLLQSADAVIVCNAPGMPEVQHQALAKYLLEGGNLIWFLYGDRTAPQIRGLSRHLPASEPMPLQIESVADLRGNGKGYVTLSEARYESPLLKAFKDPAAADLSRVRFYRFCVTSEVDPRAETLLKFEDGTAAAVRVGEGSGHLLLVNMSPAPTWSDLARQEAFLPLMHEFLKGLLAKDAALGDFSPGGAASTTLNLVSGQPLGRLTCAGPSGEDLPVTVDPTTGSVVIDQTKRTGFYRLAAKGRPVAALAVNSHPDETDLRSIDPRELESKRQRDASYLAGMAGQEADISDLNKGRPLWHLFLLAALLFLFIEQWVSQVTPRRKA
jgi:hypothetical protein